MSKLSQLKQEAYQAGKKRDWERAILAYEKILELDKNNPTVINELGDLCLKAGESGRAIRHFLSAAAKYRQTGLLNNGVAIYKKILRHDAENLNAHWYLAETRASQGLHKEGELHGLHFLKNSENINGDIKEIFLKRCCQLFELYPENQEILEKLLQTFRMWKLGLETARTQTLIACLQFDADHEDEAREAMTEVEGQHPEITNYPEYTKWRQRANPGEIAVDSYNEFDSVPLDVPTEDSADQGQEVQVPADQVPATPAVSAPVAIQAEPEPEARPAETDFSGLAPEEPLTTTEPAPDTGDDEILAEELDEDGCFSLDVETTGSFDDLISQAESAVEKPAAPMAPAPPAAGEGKVDLLAEILADSQEDERADATNQLEAITREIGEQVGGADEDADPSSLYEMGLVYLEMGLTDQACVSFQKAATDEKFSVRSFEMWGITLLRGNRPEEAIIILGKGLAETRDGTREQLGMKYHLAKALEKAGQVSEAVALLEEVQTVDPGFLDVSKCLKDWVAVP